MHHQDETHLETNPYLCRVWHRVGTQPVLPAVGTNRRVTVFGSMEVFGRGRVEVVCKGQDSACFLRYLEALERRHRETGREVILVLDNGSAHASKKSRAALAERAQWLHPIFLARYSPHLNLKEREWRYLKRDCPLALGGGFARVRGRHPRGAQAPGWDALGHRGPGSGVVHSGAPQAAHGQTSGQAEGREGLAPPQALREKEFTCCYLA